MRPVAHHASTESKEELRSKTVSESSKTEEAHGNVVLWVVPGLLTQYKVRKTRTWVTVLSVFVSREDLRGKSQSYEGNESRSSRKLTDIFETECLCAILA